MKKTTALLGLALLEACVYGCATQRKVRMIEGRRIVASLQLPRQNDFLPELSDRRMPKRDTLKITELDGRERGDGLAAGMQPAGIPEHRACEFLVRVPGPPSGLYQCTEGYDT